jgi:hypothetical protein
MVAWIMYDQYKLASTTEEDLLRHFESYPRDLYPHLWEGID